MYSTYTTNKRRIYFTQRNNKGANKKLSEKSTRTRGLHINLTRKASCESNGMMVELEEREDAHSFTRLEKVPQNSAKGAHGTGWCVVECLSFGTITSLAMRSITYGISKSRVFR